MKQQHPYIVQAGHKQSAVQRITTWLLTLLGWGLWIWLWLWHLPSQWLSSTQSGSLLSALSPQLPGLDTPALIRHGTAIALVVAALLLWALVHRVRFRQGCRRLEAPATTIDELATRVGLSPSQLVRGRNLQRIVVHHHDTGGLDRLESLDEPLMSREAMERLFGETLPQEQAAAEMQAA